MKLTGHTASPSPTNLSMRRVDERPNFGSPSSTSITTQVSTIQVKSRLSPEVQSSTHALSLVS